MNFYMIGRAVGIALMAAAFCWLVYVMVVGGELVDVWKMMTMFWFGSSVFWQVSWYEEVR